MNNSTGQDKRRYLRNSAALPVAFTLGEVVASESAYLNNISTGGMAFDSMIELATGTVLLLNLPPSRPVFRIPGRVVWCRKMSLQYAVGVEFLSTDQAFRERMVDVVRRIEDYRRETERSGRRLTAKEATIEWIERFGHELPGQ